MRRVISIAQRKGGVGKTILAVCVAAELKARGHDVRLIDSDPQCSACRRADPGILEFPVSEFVLGEESVVTWDKEVQRIKADYVVIDTAPNDRSLGAASAISDLVLVPCTPSGLDLEATIRTLEIVDAVRVRPDGVPRLILVPNRVDRRTLEGQQLVDELTAFGEYVSPPIGDRAPSSAPSRPAFRFPPGPERRPKAKSGPSPIWSNVFSVPRRLMRDSSRPKRC